MVELYVVISGWFIPLVSGGELPDYLPEPANHSGVIVRGMVIILLACIPYFSWNAHQQQR